MEVVHLERGRAGVQVDLNAVSGKNACPEQTLVQTLAPPRVRGSVVGLFNTAILGLRAGSGLTVGVLGAIINVHWSLALSAAAVVITAAGLIVAERRQA